MSFFILRKSLFDKVPETFLFFSRGDGFLSSLQSRLCREAADLLFIHAKKTEVHHHPGICSKSRSFVLKIVNLCTSMNIII